MAMSGSEMHGADGDGAAAQTIRNARVARSSLGLARDTQYLDTARQSLLGVNGFLHSDDRAVRPLCFLTCVQSVVRPAHRFVDDVVLQVAALDILCALLEEPDGQKLLMTTPEVRAYVEATAAAHAQNSRVSSLAHHLLSFLNRAVGEEGGETPQGVEEAGTLSSIKFVPSPTVSPDGGRRHVVVSTAPAAVFDEVPPTYSGNSIGGSLSSIPPSSAPASSTASPAASRPVMTRLQELEFEVGGLKLQVVTQHQALQEERSMRESLEKRLAALEAAILG